MKKSKYRKLSHTVYYCAYYIVFCPKYRYKILTGKTEVFVRNQIYRLLGVKDGVEVIELNVQPDHIHLILSVPPKYSISELMGYLKGKLARKMFAHQEYLAKMYWGKHIWTRGYCVSTVGLDEQKVRKYVKWQQDKERKN